jgi:hypothetical protein
MLLPRWQARGLMAEFLESADTGWDAVYSIWGALWFTDPERLLPLIHGRLNPGGRLVFSHAPAVPGSYGIQGMYGNGFKGRQTWIYRWAYEPSAWAELLVRHGFTEASAWIEPAPQSGYGGTLIDVISLRFASAHADPRRRGLLDIPQNAVKSYEGKDIHVVLDNLCTHTTPEVIAWLATHPHVTFHFTPVGSWTRSRTGFRSSLAKPSDAAPSAPRKPSSQGSATTSNTGAPTPSHSPGSPPPTRTSPRYGSSRPTSTNFVDNNGK